MPSPLTKWPTPSLWATCSVKCSRTSITPAVEAGFASTVPVLIYRNRTWRCMDGVLIRVRARVCVRLWLLVWKIKLIHMNSMAPDDLSTHWCSIGRVKSKILHLFRKQHFSLTITMCKVILQYFFTFKCNLTVGGSTFSSNRLWHSCDKNVFRPPRFTNNSDGVVMILCYVRI